MLVKFTVENFRVFRDEQSFSMVASPTCIKHAPEILLDTGFSAIPYLYSQAVIYGANGAGKSSLVNAFRFMTKFVRDSHNLSSLGNIETDPFIYEVDCRKKPTTLKTVFILDKTMFAYSFTISGLRVIEEYLLARPETPRRTRQIFVRRFNNETRKYDWKTNSEYLKGDIRGLKSFTRQNALFLGTAIHLNNDSMKKIYNWIVSKPVFISESDNNLQSYTAQLLYDPKWKSKIINFLNIFDVRVKDIRVISNVSANVALNNQSYENYSKNFIDDINGFTKFEISFTRNNDKGEIGSIPLEQESLGTQFLFRMAGRFLKSISKRRIIFVDELNANLHPLICQELIFMATDLCKPKRRPQLIFTTHDVTASEHDYISRNQIWMIEKKPDLSSDLYAFSDFDIPEENTFQRGYMYGRYGGAPRIVRREL